MGREVQACLPPMARSAGGTAHPVLEVCCSVRGGHQCIPDHQRAGRYLVYLPRSSRRTVPYPEGAGRLRGVQDHPIHQGDRGSARLDHSPVLGDGGDRPARTRRPQAAAPGSGDCRAGLAGRPGARTAAHLAPGHGSRSAATSTSRRRTSSSRRWPTRYSTGRSISGAAASRS